MRVSSSTSTPRDEDVPASSSISTPRDVEDASASFSRTESMNSPANSVNTFTSRVHDASRDSLVDSSA